MAPKFGQCCTYVRLGPPRIDPEQSRIGECHRRGPLLSRHAVHEDRLPLGAQLFDGCCGIGEDELEVRSAGSSESINRNSM